MVLVLDGWLIRTPCTHVNVQLDQKDISCPCYAAVEQMTGRDQITCFTSYALILFVLTTYLKIQEKDTKDAYLIYWTLVSVSELRIRIWVFRSDPDPRFVAVKICRDTVLSMSNVRIL